MTFLLQPPESVGARVRERFVRLLMVAALVACLASILQSTVSRTRPCPLCGSRMQQVRSYRDAVIYRCNDCDYEIVEAASHRFEPPRAASDTSVTRKQTALPEEPPAD